MEKPRGNLDDIVPPETFGDRIGHFFLLELGFWIAIGLLFLALEGGIVGVIVVVVFGIVVGVAWRDIARRAKNPIENQGRKGD